MDNILFMLAYLLLKLINIYYYICIFYVLFSWLIFFGLINIRNSIVMKIGYVLSYCVEPLTSYIRRFVPTFGGMDFSVLVLLLLLSFASTGIAKFATYFIG